MTKVVWMPMDADKFPPPLVQVRAHVVAQPDRKMRAFMHAAASIWVGRRGRTFLVLQCERKVDLHRVHATCASLTAAYLLRGQVEALQRLATEPSDNAKAARQMARLAGVLLPKKPRH